MELQNPMILVFVTLALSLSIIIAWHTLTDPLRNIPGPLIAQWTNLWLKLQVLRGRRVQYVHDLHQRYGHIVRISPTELAISDFEATKAIHKVNSGYLKSPWYQSFVGNAELGLFVIIDPTAHASRRRLLAQSFSKSNLTKWETLIRGRVDLAMVGMQKDAQRQGEVDVLKWWTFMATDVIAELSFGDSFHLLEQGRKNDYINDLDTTQMFSGIRSEIPGIVKLLSPIPAIRKINTLIDRLNGHAATMIQQHKNLASTEPQRLESMPTFFSKIFAAGKSQAISDAQIESEATNLLVAGSGTVAATLAYLVWAVLRNPQVHRKLIAEISDSFDLDSLPYLNAVIQETLRLYGAVPAGLPRIVPPNGRTLVGHFLPAGLTVTTQAFTLHRDPTIYDDPESFLPERWLHPTKTMEDAFMPWGGGSRGTCAIWQPSFD